MTNNVRISFCSLEFNFLAAISRKRLVFIFEASKSLVAAFRFISRSSRSASTTFSSSRIFVIDPAVYSLTLTACLLSVELSLCSSQDSMIFAFRSASMLISMMALSSSKMALRKPIWYLNDCSKDSRSLRASSSFDLSSPFIPVNLGSRWEILDSRSVRCSFNNNNNDNNYNNTVDNQIFLLCIFEKRFRRLSTLIDRSKLISAQF